MENAAVDLPKTPEEQWKEFMPPDDYVPDWKRQFQAMERETQFKKWADRAKFAFLGAAIVLAVSILPYIPYNVHVRFGLVAAMLLAQIFCMFAAMRMKIRAHELDRKLDETIRVEKEPVVEAQQVSEQKA